MYCCERDEFYDAFLDAWLSYCRVSRTHVDCSVSNGTRNQFFPFTTVLQCAFAGMQYAVDMRALIGVCSLVTYVCVIQDADSVTSPSFSTRYNEHSRCFSQFMMFHVCKGPHVGGGNPGGTCSAGYARLSNQRGSLRSV